MNLSLFFPGNIWKKGYRLQSPELAKLNSIIGHLVVLLTYATSGFTEANTNLLCRNLPSKASQITLIESVT